MSAVCPVNLSGRHFRTRSALRICANRRHCRLEVIEQKVAFACACVHNVPPERSAFAVPRLKPLVGKDDPTIVEAGGIDAEVAALKLEPRLKSLRLEAQGRVFS